MVFLCMIQFGLGLGEDLPDFARVMSMFPYLSYGYIPEPGESVVFFAGFLDIKSNLKV